ncbi:hypothetical protein C0992_011299 [Termitomyces sp. T32_za158]|nr:hypothetical protein C0992_011299 [Termitomyces sp. T32_za158]
MQNTLLSFPCVVHERELNIFSFVCAMNPVNMSDVRLFRSYDVPIRPDEGKIWEVARATTAEHMFFKSIFIGSEPPEEFTGASLRFNNPTGVVRKEAKRFLKKDGRIACILNIGTGHPNVLQLPQSNKFQDSIPQDMAKKLMDIAQDCENEAEEYEREYGDGSWRIFAERKRTYYRLNVQHGLQDVSPLEWTKLGEVKTHTRQYMKSSSAGEIARQVMEVLKTRRRHQDGPAPPAYRKGT